MNTQTVLWFVGAVLVGTLAGFAYAASKSA
jgi:hypothetical protein